MVSPTNQPTIDNRSTFPLSFSDCHRRAMLVMLFIIISALLSPLSANEWEDILRADVTCCNPVDDADICAATTGGAGCLWLENGISDDIDAVITESGSQCVGATYYQCRMETDRCCQPGCEKDSSEESDDSTEISCWYPCSPRDATNSDRVPFRARGEPAPKCVLGLSYAFEGVPCQISGDPHTTMWNGGHHDFQGQPDQYTAAGTALKNQFYYVAPCSDMSAADLPVTILGTHLRFRETAIAGLGYLVLELFDRRHEATATFNIYLSASIASYAARAVEGVSTDYDDTKAVAPSALHAIEKDTTTAIGDRFSAVLSADGAADSAAVTLALTVDGENTITIFMEALMSAEVRHAGHSVLIEQAEAYKCASCGLCGNFKHKAELISDAQKLERCDGSMVALRSGHNADAPEAYDPDGWTWEKNFFENECANDEAVQYDIADNGDGFEFVSYEHIGCWIAGEDAAEAQHRTGVVDITECLDFCVDGNFEVFGVIDARNADLLCVCAISEAEFQQNGASVICNEGLGAGDDGAMAMDVYKITTDNGSSTRRLGGLSQPLSQPTMQPTPAPSTAPNTESSADSDILVALSAAFAMGIILATLIYSLCARRRASVGEFKIKLLLREYSSSRVMLGLSHLSQLLMLGVSALVLLTYAWPASSALCSFYWKGSVMAYTAALFAVKWIYDIRIYAFSYKTGDHRMCRRVIFLFWFQCVCCCGVVVALPFFLHAEAVDGVCELSLEKKFVWCGGPIGLIMMDAVCYSAFNSKVFGTKGVTSEMKAPMKKHFALTLLSFVVCIIDYVINVAYMDSNLPLIAVVADSALVTLCNVLMVNDQIIARNKIAQQPQLQIALAQVRVMAEADATVNVATTVDHTEHSSHERTTTSDLERADAVNRDFFNRHGIPAFTPGCAGI